MTRLLIANFSFITMGLTLGMLGVAWDAIQQTYGLSLDAVGLMLAMLTIGRLIASLTGGWSIAKMGMHRYLWLGSLVSALGYLGHAVAPSWPTLLIAGLALGIGSNMINVGVNTAVASTYRSSRMNWLHGWFGVGSTLGPLLPTLIVLTLGLSWRWSYAVAFVLQALVTAAFLVSGSQWQDTAMPAEPAATARPAGRVSDSLRLSATWFSVALFFLHGGSQVGTGQLTHSLLVDGRGFDPLVAGTWISVYWGSLTAGRFLLGTIIDRAGDVLTLRVSLFGNIIGSLLLWQAQSDSANFAALVLIGFTLAPILPTLTGQTPARVGLAHSGTVIGLQSAASGIGSALLPGLAAWLVARAGYQVIPEHLALLAVLSFVLHEIWIGRESRQLRVSPARK